MRVCGGGVRRGWGGGEGCDLCRTPYDGYMAYQRAAILLEVDWNRCHCATCMEFLGGPFISNLHSTMAGGYKY